MEIFISSIYSRHTDLPSVVQELAGLGFSHIELTGNISYCSAFDQKIKNLRKQYGCEFSLHNYIPFWPQPYVINLASSNPESASTALSHVRKAVRLIRGLGRKIYSVHPGYHYDLLPGKWF
jgi:sugar phosphate isomerase/epimerase